MGLGMSLSAFTDIVQWILWILWIADFLKRWRRHHAGPVPSRENAQRRARWRIVLRFPDVAMRDLVLVREREDGDRWIFDFLVPNNDAFEVRVGPTTVEMDRTWARTPLSASDIIPLISEGGAMEQILIRNLPAGTKVALRARAERHQRSVESEARAILTEALDRAPASLVDFLAMDSGVDIVFEPERLGLTARTSDL